MSVLQIFDWWDKKLICDSRITNPYSNYDLCLVKILQLLCLEKTAVFP